MFLVPKNPLKIASKILIERTRLALTEKDLMLLHRSRLLQAKFTSSVPKYVSFSTVMPRCSG